MFRTPFAVVALAASAISVSALAHPKVVTASPAADSVTPAPAKITLQMTEKLEPKFSGLELMKVDGTNVPVASKVGGADGKTIEAAIKSKLAPGQYMVMWHAVGGDGHRVKGDYNFTVK